MPINEKLRSSLIDQYRNREDKWTERALNQFTFTSNLFLSLSIGVLAFLYTDISLVDVVFSFNVDWPLTSMVLSLFFTFCSILCGIVVTLSRLFDFRIARQINTIRRRMVKHSGIKMEEATVERLSLLRQVILLLTVVIKIPNISIEDCKKYNNFSPEVQKKMIFNFSELRKISSNMGHLSWRFTSYQILSFFLSVSLYMFGM